MRNEMLSLQKFNNKSLVQRRQLGIALISINCKVYRVSFFYDFQVSQLTFDKLDQGRISARNVHVYSHETSSKGPLLVASALCIRTLTPAIFKRTK